MSPISEFLLLASLVCVCVCWIEIKVGEGLICLCIDGYISMQK